MKFYLSGSMEYKEDLGEAWRTWLTKELAKGGIGVVDPVKLEEPNGDGIPIQRKLSKLKREGKYEEVRIGMRPIMRVDIMGVSRCDDIVLLYDEGVQQGAGTMSEGWDCFREGIPIYVITDFPSEKIPTWLIGMSTQIFSNFEEFLFYVHNYITLSSDSVTAQIVKKEVFEGIEYFGE